MYRDSPSFPYRTPTFRVQKTKTEPSRGWEDLKFDTTTMSLDKRCIFDSQPRSATEISLFSSSLACLHIDDSRARLECEIVPDPFRHHPARDCGTQSVRRYAPRTTATRQRVPKGVRGRTEPRLVRVRWSPASRSTRHSPAIATTLW